MQYYDIANVLNSHDRGHDLGGTYSCINALGLWYGTGSSPSHNIPHYIPQFFTGRTWSLLDKIILTIILTLDNLIFIVLSCGYITMPLIKLINSISDKIIINYCNNYYDIIEHTCNF